MTSQAQLAQRLRDSQEAIAEEWYQAIAGTSHTAPGVGSTRQHLIELTGKAIELMLDDPFDTSAARGIGAALADLHYLQPEALGRTLGVLGSQLAAAMPAGQLRASHTRLIGLLEELSAGYYQTRFIEAETGIIQVK